MENTRFFENVRAFFARVPRVLLLPFSALLMGLCLLFPKVGMLQWISLLPALYYLLPQIGQMRLRRAYALGLLYFGAFYLMVWHWFVELYPMEFAGITRGEAIVLIAICWFGLSLLQTVFSALLLDRKSVV